MWTWRQDGAKPRGATPEITAAEEDGTRNYLQRLAMWRNENLHDNFLAARPFRRELYLDPAWSGARNVLWKYRKPALANEETFYVAVHVFV